MKNAILIFAFALSASLLHAAYPGEYPTYLGLLGFSKGEIRDLRDGRLIEHSISNRLPGESGVIAAKVINVPAYYFRDYYGSIESYRTIRNFVQVEKFKLRPELQDLRALQFDQEELRDFAGCRSQGCRLGFADDEISQIPPDLDTTIDSGRGRGGDLYRKILLDRLLKYQKQGTDNPEVFKNHLAKFAEIDAYFPKVETYLVEYPHSELKRSEEFFYWARESLGGKRRISIHHAVSLKVGEDYILVDRLVSSSPLLLSSVRVTHLLNYLDGGMPRCLAVVQQRTLAESGSSPATHIPSELKAASKEMEERYRDPAYASFPYGMHSRNQQ